MDGKCAEKHSWHSLGRVQQAAQDDVSFPLRYIRAGVAGPQQTATALPRASSTLKEPLPPETASKQSGDCAEGIIRTPPETDRADNVC